MATMFIRGTVEDYEAWKPIFDSLNDLRGEYGQQSYRILRQGNGSNDLIALFEWDNLENARAYASSAELREAMAGAGFKNKPEFLFLDEADRG